MIISDRLATTKLRNNFVSDAAVIRKTNKLVGRCQVQL
jgi:hypothetical protein